MSMRSAPCRVDLMDPATMVLANVNASGCGPEHSVMPVHAQTNAVAMESALRRVCVAVLLAGLRRTALSINVIEIATLVYATLEQGIASATKATSQQTAVRSCVKARV